MLVFVNGEENNNKFYHLSLHDDGTVAKRWGRVGSEGTAATELSGRSGYDRIIRSKERKGYRRTEVESSVQVKTLDQAVAKEAAASALLGDVKAADPAVAAFVDLIIAENRHAISTASGGLITVSDDGIVRTALGVVSLGNILAARRALDGLAALISSRKPMNVNLLNDYLTLIPQKVPSKRGWADTFLTEFTTVTKQRDLLDQLESSIALATTAAKAAVTKAAGAQPAVDFRYKVALLDDKKEFTRIKDFFEGTKNSRHHPGVSGLKLKRVFVLTDSDVHAKKFAAAKKSLGNTRELWHGTLVGNLLSILRKGMYVPPTSGTTIRIAGRMFGDGIYFSDQSTKSLNYSHGFWGGSTGGSRDNCFMLLNDVVLGNEFRPYQNGGWNGRNSIDKAHNGSDEKGKPFHSISVKGGTAGVMNNEIIVWDTDNIKVSYICEFDR